MMDLEVLKRPRRKKIKKTLIVSIITFVLLVLAAASQYAYSILTCENIYTGVYIEDLDASNISPDDLRDLLVQKYQKKFDASFLELKSGGFSEKIYFSDIDVLYDIDAFVDKAYKVGRTGNLLNRLYEIYTISRYGKKINMLCSFDGGKLKNIIDSLHDKIYISVTEAELIITDSPEKVLLRSGQYGKSFDKNKAYSDAREAIENRLCSIVKVSVISTPPKKIDMDGIYKKINREAQDATVKIENNNYTIIPHVIGRTIDKASLSTIASELEKKENVEIELPMIYITPNITTEKIDEALFSDTLYSASTQFGAATQNEKNRGNNIRIAVSKINGTILAPGQVFSFNTTVGPRTVDGGYKIAHTYVGGKVVDGIGGGICQVSTTLYNAVLFSDLEVMKRSNHYFRVNYVPGGRDAAVSYGQVDLQFKNSTAWPVKIVGTVTNSNKIIMTIKGTNETPGKTVELRHVTLKTTDFKEVFIDDPSLGEGKTVVERAGVKGYVIDTYKIIKQDGETTSETKIHTSVYKPLDKEIRRGVKKPPILPPLKMPEEIKGVDDADNPPAILP